MKIAVISPDRLPIPAVSGGAIETLTTHLLDENERQGSVDITVFSYGNVEAKRKILSYKKTKFFLFHLGLGDLIYNFFWSRIYKLTSCKVYARRALIKRIKRYLLNEKFDAIVVEGNFLQVLQLKSLNIPLFLHLHTDILNKKQPLTYDVVASCDKVWTISNFLKRQIELCTGAQDKILIYRNTVDSKVFFYDYQEGLKKELNIPENDKIFVYCGRIVPIKGVWELVLAFEKANLNDASLLIVGGSRFQNSTLTEYERRIFLYVTEKKLKVFFTGYIPQEKLRHYYSISDVCVFPSICNEAAGLVLIEAMCCGLPVITTSMGGIPEYANYDCCSVIDYDPTTFIDRLSEEISLFAKDESYYQEKKKHVFDNVDEFNLNSYYRRFLELVNCV